MQETAELGSFWHGRLNPCAGLSWLSCVFVVVYQSTSEYSDTGRYGPNLQEPAR